MSTNHAGPWKRWIYLIPRRCPPLARQQRVLGPVSALARALEFALIEEARCIARMKKRHQQKCHLLLFSRRLEFGVGNQSDRLPAFRVQRRLRKNLLKFGQLWLAHEEPPPGGWL